MTELKINSFNECQQCGVCCKNPCDIIPSDLPSLLKQFKMSLPDFFEKYLIALLIASPQYADEVLMMVPVKVDSNGNRTEKFLADQKYLNNKGMCIFLKENECSINVIKPFGGRFLQCKKITGSVQIQLQKKQYFAYWHNNQHLFELIHPGFLKLFNELKNIFQRKNEILSKKNKANNRYNRLSRQQSKIMEQKMYPLFNNRKPEDGYSVLVN